MGSAFQEVSSDGDVCSRKRGLALASCGREAIPEARVTRNRPGQLRGGEEGAPRPLLTPELHLTGFVQTERHQLNPTAT